MSWQLDAWLERSTPILRILDGSSGTPIAQFRGEEVHRLMERGELITEDLLSNDGEERKALAGRLFSIACGVVCI